MAFSRLLGINSLQVTDRRVLLLGGWTAIVWSITRILVLAMFILLRPDWNPITQTASELGRVGASNAWLFNLLNFSLGGVFLAVFALCLYRALGPGWASLGATLLLLLGAASFTVDAFVNLPSRLHVPLALPFFLASPFASLLVAAALRQPTWRTYRRISLVVGILWISVTVASVLLQKVGLPPGLAQRMLQVASTTWFLLIAVWMLGEASRTVPKTGRH